MLTASPLPLPLLDIFFASHEVDLVRYRLRAQAAFTYKVVIVESRLSFSGNPKPLHLRDRLAPEEVQQYNVVFDVVEFSAEDRARHCFALFASTQTTNPYIVPVARLACHQATWQTARDLARQRRAHHTLRACSAGI